MKIKLTASKEIGSSYSIIISKDTINNKQTNNIGESRRSPTCRSNSAFSEQLAENFKQPFHSRLSSELPDFFSLTASPRVSPHPISMNQEEVFRVDQEIEEMLRKAVIKLVQPAPNQIVITILQDPRKMPVIVLW